ncbi:MAG: DUF1294 domain-containing protein [Clostridia bacterium]|nr:DUF1294 domain-containing protein [Clostridia bacterium]
MSTVDYVLSAYALICCLAGFVAMFADKRAAVRSSYRIPERTLLTVAAIGGALGVCAGMWLFRHKTKHRSFYLGAPLLLALNVIVFAAAFFYL